MNDKFVESVVGARRRTRGVGTRLVVLALAVAMAGLPQMVRPAAAGTIDPNVVGFGASPSFINLNRTTTITVEIGTSYGAGLDNYRATVTAPGGGTATAWYNFTGAPLPETLSQVYGDASAGFRTAADEVGTYDLRLEYFNGVIFSLAGVSELQVTNMLRITFSTRSASDPFTSVHSCPVASEFVRGAKFIGGAFIQFESTGEYVNATNSPSAAGNITGAIFGATFNLNPAGSPPYWHSGWKFGWNIPTGQAKFYINASDGRGNFGSAVTGSAPHPRVTIVADTLVVSTKIVNSTGVERVSFAPGQTFRVEVNATYNDKQAHETVADPNPVDPYNGPLTTARGGQVKAHIGWGAFNATSSMFANTLTNLTLTYDSTTRIWSASFTIPTTTANRTAVQALITSSDGATPANTGAVFTTQFAIQAPPSPEIIEVEVPVDRSTGFEMPVVAGLSVVLLIVGLGIGFVVSRMRKGTSAAPMGEEKEAEKKPEDEWEER